MLLRILPALALVSSPLSAQEDAAKDTADTTLIVLETTAGDITVALETERAPATAANFLRYVDEDRFDGTVFYRAMHLDWGAPPMALSRAARRTTRNAYWTESSTSRPMRPA